MIQVLACLLGNIVMPTGAEEGCVKGGRGILDLDRRELRSASHSQTILVHLHECMSSRSSKSNALVVPIEIFSLWIFQGLFIVAKAFIQSFARMQSWKLSIRQPFCTPNLRPSFSFWGFNFRCMRSKLMILLLGYFLCVVQFKRGCLSKCEDLTTRSAQILSFRCTTRISL